MAIHFPQSDIGRATGFVRSASQCLSECVSAEESKQLRAMVDSLREAIEDLESAIIECDLNDLERSLS